MPFSPAIIRTATWEVVAWNKAASVILTDYAKLARRELGYAPIMTRDAGLAEMAADWQNAAR